MMKKMLLLTISVIILSVIFAGCTENQRPPDYPYEEEYDVEFTDVDIQLDKYLFDFSEIVLENGSVANTTDRELTIRMVNYGNISADDIEFEIQQIPPDLQVWTTIVFCDIDDANFYLYKKGKMNGCGINEISAGGNISVTIRIRLNNASAWIYENNELYTILLQCSWRGKIKQHCSQGNTYYDYTHKELVIPLKVKT